LKQAIKLKKTSSIRSVINSISLLFWCQKLISTTKVLVKEKEFPRIFSRCDYVAWLYTYSFLSYFIYLCRNQTFLLFSKM